MDDSRPILIELQYLPPLEYFVLFLGEDNIMLDAHEHYVKQSYRNRSYIRGPHQVEILTVPVSGGSKKILTSQIRIDYSQPWVQQHWRALQAAYGKAPFFEHYAPYFQECYQQASEYLWELNLALLTLCLKLLQIDKTIHFSNAYLYSTNPTVRDYRSGINPKKNGLENKIYRPQPYNQIFGKDFVGNLSIIDLLFCEGPAARLILEESTGARLNN